MPISGDTHTIHDLRPTKDSNHANKAPALSGRTEIAEALATLIDQTALTGTLRALQNEVASLRREIRDMKRHADPQRGPDFLRLKEVAARLNLSPKSVRRLVGDRLLRRMAGCRHILIPASDVTAYQQRVLLQAPPA
jgi:excisionase family DNA binding protein